MATKKLGTMVDQLFKIKDSIAEHRRTMLKGEEKLAKLKAKYKTKEDEIIATFPEENLRGGAGKLGAVALHVEPIPTIDNWDELYGYIYKQKAGDLLQRRINKLAYNDRLADGKKVPGVKIFNKKTLRLRKA